MANPTANATLRALVGHVITELMIKTSGEQVYLNDTTTVSSKIAELVAAVNSRAKTADVNALVDGLRQEILGDTPVEAYNTFTELAKYVTEHKDISDALTEAIGQKVNTSDFEELESTVAGLAESKADQTNVDSLRNSVEGHYTNYNTFKDSLGKLAYRDTVATEQLSSALKDKINKINVNTNDISTLKTGKADTTTLTEQIDVVKGLINDLRQEILGDTPVEAYNTFTELAAFIAEHQDIADALTEALTAKANQATVDDILDQLDTFGEMATRDIISEDDLSEELKLKLNGEGDHTHTNYAALNSITESKIKSWDGKATIHISKDAPTNWQPSDLWFDIN